MAICRAITLVALVWAHTTALSAATWTVDSPSDNAALNACTAAPADCSLHGALQRAASSGDTIVMAVAASGPGMLLINKSITLEGNNAFLPRIEVANVDPLIVLNVRIRNARWEGLSRALVVFPTHSVVLEDVIFRNNTTFSGPGGGAIDNKGGFLTVRRSLFENNEARGFPGGAILSTGTSQFNGHLVIEDSRFDGNYSDRGGSAIHHVPVTGRSFALVVQRSTFLRNGLAEPSTPASSARGFFGAIRTDGYTYIDDSYFAENDSRYASAIQAGGELEVFNSTFYRNATRDTVGEGGAMLLATTRARFTHLTLVENSGTPTGGLYVYPNANVQIVNSLLADNVGSHPNISGMVGSRGNNLISNISGANIFMYPNAEPDLYNVNGQWQVPADNGGPTFTAGLSAQSPAIDAGSNCVLSANACGSMGIGAVAFDQRGVGFPRKRGNRPDIGAFESNFAIVRNTLDSGAGSLRQTIADAVAGDIVRFSPAVFSQPRTINLLSTLVVNKTLTVEGPGLELLTLDAGGGRRHLNVDAGINLLLTGLRFTRGDPGGTVSGGAILNNGGTLEVRDAAFEDNAAQIGGCLYNVGTLTLTRVRMSNCRARAAAGGLFNASGATATIGDIRIEGSSAVDNGGAIGNDGNLLAFRVAMIGNQARFGGAFSEYGTTTLRNSTLSGNTASGPGGGAIHVDVGGRLTLTHATVTLNNATTQGGGGLWNNGGVVELQNSVIAGNSGAGGLHDARGVLRSLGHNLIGNTSGSSFAPDSPSLVGNQLGVAARLGPLADNGGFGRTHAPDHDSPLYDAAAAALGFDGRGLIRPRDFTHLANAAGGNGSDIGAYELQVATPDNVVATAQPGAVSVSFNGGDRGGLAITEYTVSCGAVSASGTASPIVVSGLSSVPVSCVVRAWAGSERGVASAPSNSVTPLAVSTTSFLASTPTSSVQGMPLEVDVQVDSPTARIAAGSVVVTASSGESCNSSVPLTLPGNAARFRCVLFFNSPGNVSLSAAYSGSATHAPSTSAPRPHQVIALPTLSINDAVVVEGNGSGAMLEFTVTRSHNLNPVSVFANTMDGTASAGSDYNAFNLVSLAFSAGGALSQTLTVQIQGDAVLEADETLFVDLVNPDGATLGDARGQGTIQNDDLASIAIQDVTLAEGNVGNTAFQFNVTLTGAVQGGFTVPVSSSDGSASAGSDYTAIPAGTSLSFAGTAGETQSITVQVTGDTILEANEIFSVALGTPSNTAVAVPTAIATASIQNDDSASIAIQDVTLAEGNVGNTAFQFNVALTGAVQGGLTMPVSSSDGSASAGSDYTAIPAGTNLSFAGTAGETQSITVQITGDALLEANETFSVALGAPSNAAVLVTTAIGTGTILNDDSASLAINDVTQVEGNSGTTSFQFVVTLSGTTPSGFSVPFTTADGSATAPGDYASQSGTLNFAGTHGETQTITVAVVGDAVVEPSEGFGVGLGTPSNPAVTLADATGAGVISNDDSTTIAINDVSLAEGNSGNTAFQFTVTLAGAVQGGVNVPFSTSNGSATAPEDYSSQTGILNFTGTAGETRTVTINVIGDTLFEADEQFLVNLSAPANASVSLADGSGQATIQNDDRAALTLSASAAPNPSSASATVTVTATLSLPQGAAAPSGAIQVANGAVNLCAITLPALSCSYTPNYLGPQNLTLSYLGDANVLPANASTSHTALRFADLSISKDDGRTVVNAGDVLTYTIVLRNDGPDQAGGVQVEDLIPATLSNASWTCSGVVCTSASGTGSIQQTLSLPANQQVTYTLTATVVSPAPAFVENMARLTISNAAPHYVFDPDSADHIAIDVNLGDGLFRSGFELP